MTVASMPGALVNRFPFIFKLFFANSKTLLRSRSHFSLILLIEIQTIIALNILSIYFVIVSWMPYDYFWKCNLTFEFL